MHNFWFAPCGSVVLAGTFEHGKVFAVVDSKPVVMVDHSIASVEESGTGNIAIRSYEKACCWIPFLFAMS